MLLDAIKLDWFEGIYQIPEDEHVKTLYSCLNKQTFKFDSDTLREICENEKDKYIDYTQPLYDMVDEIYKYTSLKQLKK